VLLADDYPDMVKAVSRLLALDCEVVGTVTDGSDLLAAAQRLRPEVVVLDLNLPHVHGLEACRQITQAHPEIKVIVFTAMGGPDVGQLSVAAGASAFVSKLEFANDLLSTIKRLCADPS
jgi:CheY-like chemotaxis protein